MQSCRSPGLVTAGLEGQCSVDLEGWGSGGLEGPEGRGSDSLEILF